MGTDLAACPRAHVNSGSRKRSVSIMWPLHPEASGAKRWGCSDPSPSAWSVWVTARRGAVSVAGSQVHCFRRGGLRGPGLDSHCLRTGPSLDLFALQTFTELLTIRDGEVSDPVFESS